MRRETLTKGPFRKTSLVTFPDRPGAGFASYSPSIPGPLCKNRQGLPAADLSAIRFLPQISGLLEEEEEEATSSINPLANREIKGRHCFRTVILLPEFCIKQDESLRAE